MRSESSKSADRLFRRRYSSIAIVVVGIIVVNVGGKDRSGAATDMFSDVYRLYVGSDGNSVCIVFLNREER